MNYFPPSAISRFPPIPTTGALAAGFALIVKGFCDTIAERSGRRLFPALLAALMWARLRRLALRIESLAAKFRAGTLHPPRPKRPRPAPKAPLKPAPAPRPSRAFGWIGQLVPEARVHAGFLERWLAEPEVAALLQAAPQAARLLRPLCHMAGIRPDPALLPPLPARRRAKPRPEPPSPDQGDAALAALAAPAAPSRREQAEARRAEARWAAAYRRSLGVRKPT